MFPFARARSFGGGECWGGGRRGKEGAVREWTDGEGKEGKDVKEGGEEEEDVRKGEMGGMFL